MKKKLNLVGKVTTKFKGLSKKGKIITVVGAVVLGIALVPTAENIESKVEEPKQNIEQSNVETNITENIEETVKPDTNNANVETPKVEETVKDKVEVEETVEDKAQEEKEIKNQEQINKTVRTQIVNTMKTNFEKQGMKVTSQVQGNILMISVEPNAGFTLAAIQDIKNNNSKDWNNVVNNFKGLSKTASKTAKELGADFTVALAILNDVNTENCLLMVTDGIVVNNLASQY